MGWQRPTLEKSPIRPKRCPVGVADWRTLGGPPRPIPVVPDLSQAVSAMGSLRRDDEDHDCSCARTQCPRHNRRTRSLHRREFRARQKRGRKVGKTKRGNGTKIAAVADRNGLPVSVCAESATPHEVTLAMSALLQIVVPDTPQNLIGDNAYDSDRLDAELRFYGIELIAPHRRNRRNSTQDGRRLKRYRRRWKIERLFAWLQNFRRLVVRYERHAENFRGMLQLASSLILLRYL